MNCKVWLEKLRQMRSHNIFAGPLFRHLNGMRWEHEFKRDKREERKKERNQQ